MSRLHGSLMIRPDLVRRRIFCFGRNCVSRMSEQGLRSAVELWRTRKIERRSRFFDSFAFELRIVSRRSLRVETGGWANDKHPHDRALELERNQPCRRRARGQR
jgi:hypothetical protein